eukprot:gene30134-37630_t
MPPGGSEHYRGLGWRVIHDPHYIKLRDFLDPSESPTSTTITPRPARKVPRSILPGGTLNLSDFTVLKPTADTPTITEADSKKSFENLQQFLLQASPLARKNVTSDGEAEWILLCPPELWNHAANTAHLLHGCGGRDDARKTLRSHSITNIPDSVIMPILQSCPNCLINKAPPPMRHTTAIRPRGEERVQCWDCTMFGEGTEGQIHAVDMPGTYHEVFHIDTEKMFVVAAAMAKSWMSYDAPGAIRCDNGPAF